MGTFWLLWYFWLSNCSSAGKKKLAREDACMSEMDSGADEAQLQHDQLQHACKDNVMMFEISFQFHIHTLKVI